MNRWKRRVGSILLLTGMAAWTLTGCGKEEAVHTSAVQEEEESMGAQETEATEAEESAEPTSASVAQAEIDDEMKNELTIELLEENQLDTSVVENTRNTTGCSFSLPEDFAEAEDQPGMYVTGRYPIDASTICYAELEQDISLQLMTEETFRQHMEEQFAAAQEEAEGLSIDSFDKIELDGYPGFRILCRYTIGSVEITQLEYIINADKSYVIIYSQTGEYDRMEEYEASAATIRLEF